MKRIIAAISAGASVCVTAWLGGFDFDARGSTAMFVFFTSMVSSVFAYLLAGLDW